MAYKVAEKLNISRKQLYRIETRRVKEEVFLKYARKLAELYCTTEEEILSAWKEGKENG